MRIAIFGAAGAIGQATLPELLARGHQVRLVGRNHDKLAALAAGYDGVEIVAADLTDPAAARRAATGIDAVLFSVGLPYQDFAQYPGITKIALEAAHDAGVRRFIAISTVYPYGYARTATVTEFHPREPHTRKGIARKEQADMVLAAHDPAGMNTAVLVLPDFYGPTAELSYAREIFTGALSGKTASIVGPLDVPHELVFVPDAAVAVAELFARPDLFGRTWHFGGTGTITFRDLITTVERLSGARVRVLQANKTMLRLLGIVSPLMREIVEMYYLFTHPVVLDDRALRDAIPNLPATPYTEGVARTLQALRTPVTACA
jgi:nucleoside-diphosphate-sugar epimerase